MYQYPPNPTSYNMLAISDSGANIHLSKQTTTKMAPVIMSNKMTARLPYGSTMDSSHIETLHIPGLSKQARKIQFFRKTRTSPLIASEV